MGSFDTLARSGSKSFRVAIGLADGPINGEFAVQFAEGTLARPLKEIALELQLSDSPTLEMGPTLTVVRESS